MRMKKRRTTKRNRVLAGIAIFKYVKAVLLIAGGLGAIELLHDGAMTRAEDAIAAIASPFIRSELAHLLGGAEDMSSGRLKASEVRRDAAMIRKVLARQAKDIRGQLSDLATIRRG